MTNYMNQYDQLSQFETLEELNATVKTAGFVHYDELSVTQYEVLDFISRHAVKVLGVAKLKVDTIAKAIGKSVRTINYATKKLDEIGIVKKLSTVRAKSGGSGANIYVIQRIDDDALQTDLQERCRPTLADCADDVILRESKAEPPISENETLSSFKLFSKTLNKSLSTFEKNNNHNLVKDIELGDEPLFADTPDCLRLAYALLNDSSLGNKLTKRIVSAYKNSGLAFSMPWTLQDLCIQDSKVARELGDRIAQSIRNKKDGTEDSLCAYVYTTALNMFNEYKMHVDAPSLCDVDEVDFINHPFTQRLLNAKIEDARHVKLDDLTYGQVSVTDDDLPW